MLFPGGLWGAVHMVWMILWVLASLVFSLPYQLGYPDLLWAPGIWHVVHFFPGEDSGKEVV